MSQPCFDHYHRYEDLSRTLRDLASEYTGLARLESIGTSHEGRDVWLMTVTNFGTGLDLDKPGFWVDGNIHAAELAGSVACLHFIHYLLTRYGTDPDVTRCLDSRVFYICPRVNPDGAEWALADHPRIRRSSTRPYPWQETPQGLSMEDIDGDGRILTMRIPDPDGAWKASPVEPRLLVPRDPAESGGDYYRLLPEGRLDDFDGITIAVPPPREQLDLNRNFPAQWREEHEQRGAGEYPTSEPEVRNVVRFITTHANICAGVAFHTYSGVLLRPMSYRSDDDIPAEDLRIFKTLGARGSALTGYPHASTYHEFRYHPQEVITGALDDWLYDQRGVFAWTVEIWSPQRQAGLGPCAYLDWYRDHPFEHDLQLLAWSDTALAGQGYIDWYPFPHPQLGTVELGGWNALYSFYNPPPALLEAEISRFAPWLVWHHLTSPRLELLRADAERLETGLYRIRLVVRNSGWLPTYISQIALKKKLTRGVMAEIALPAQAQLVSGQQRQELGQLEGRAHKNCSPTGWAAYVADPTTERCKVEWIVRAQAGASVTLKASHERAGRLSTNVTLP